MNRLRHLARKFLIVEEFWFDEDFSRSSADVVRLRQCPTSPPDGSAEPFHTLIHDLTNDEEYLWSTLDKSCRYEVRRAEKEGVIVDFGLQDNAAVMREFCSAHRKMSERKSLQPFNPVYLNNLGRKRRLFLSVSRSADETLCSWHLYLLHGKRARLLYSVSLQPGLLESGNGVVDRRAFLGRANRLHHWRDMLHFRKNGFTIYDWGGWYSGQSDKAKLGINAFKEGFGGHPEASFNVVIPRSMRGRLALFGRKLLGRMRPQKEAVGSQASLDAINKQTFNRSDKQYAAIARQGLTTQESVCFHGIPEERRGTILDIGIGAGRTTGPLADIFKLYEGVDYAENLMKIAKRIYPSLNLHVMDARHLDATSAYECISFSYNGLDYIDYSARLKFFVAVFRALRPGGYFLYSTHNAGYRRVSSYLNRLFLPELIPYCRKPWRLPGLLLRRIRNFERQKRSPDGRFCIVNDPGLKFDLLTTYVDVHSELEILRGYGFEVQRTIGCRKQDDRFDVEDAWVYIVARKPEAQ